MIPQHVGQERVLKTAEKRLTWDWEGPQNPLSANRVLGCTRSTEEKLHVSQNTHGGASFSASHRALVLLKAKSELWRRLWGLSYAETLQKLQHVAKAAGVLCLLLIALITAISLTLFPTSASESSCCSLCCTLNIIRGRPCLDTPVQSFPDSC